MEDDTVSRVTLAMLLRHLGFAVREAATLAEAFRHLDYCSHVLLDLGLQDGYGTELAEEVRRRQLPVRLAVTTAMDSHSPVVARVRAFEPDLILRKPVQLGRILEWLEPATRRDDDDPST